MEVFEMSYSGSPRGLMNYIGEAICEHCHGEGVVTSMGFVYAGEPHMAPIEERVCECQLSEPDYDNQDNG